MIDLDLQYEFEQFVTEYTGCFFFCCPDGKVLVWNDADDAENDDGAKAINKFLLTKGKPCPAWAIEMLLGEDYEVG